MEKILSPLRALLPLERLVNVYLVHVSLLRGPEAKEVFRIACVSQGCPLPEFLLLI